MKNITKYSLLIFPFLFILVFVLITGCTKDPNPSPGPADARSSFLGRWNVNEIWTKMAYEVNITTDPGSDDGVFITNFANTGSSGTPAGARITGATIILDANQIIGDGLKINGSGNFVSNKITWNYTLDDGATLINAIATYTKL